MRSPRRSPYPPVSRLAAHFRVVFVRLSGNSVRFVLLFLAPAPDLIVLIRAESARFRPYSSRHNCQVPSLFAVLQLYCPVARRPLPSHFKVAFRLGLRVGCWQISASMHQGADFVGISPAAFRFAHFPRKLAWLVAGRALGFQLHLRLMRDLFVSQAVAGRVVAQKGGARNFRVTYRAIFGASFSVPGPAGSSSLCRFRALRLPSFGPTQGLLPWVSAPSGALCSSELP